MSALTSRAVTVDDLRTTSAVLRGEDVSVEAIQSLLEIAAPTAEQVLSPRVRPALWLAVLSALLGQLRGTSVSRSEIEEAMLIFRLVQRSTQPASALALDEAEAVQAALRGEPDAAALAALLGQEVAATRAFLLEAGDSRALDAVLFTHLVARLHGLRVDANEVLYASLAVAEYELAKLRPDTAN